MSEQNKLDEIWSSIGTQEEEESQTSLQNETEGNLLDAIYNSLDEEANQNQEQEQPEAQIVVDRNSLLVEEPEEEQGLLSIIWDSMKSGAVRTGAGLLKFAHEANYNKYIYKDVIKEYGSIEAAMEAKDPRALMAQQYVTQDGEVMDTTEYLMDISEKIAPDVEQDVIQSFKDRRWGDFVEGAVSGVAQNVPDLVARALITAGTGNPWLATTHVFGSVVGQKYIEMDELGGYSDKEQMVIAGLQGSIEYLAERLGTGRVLDNLVKKVGMEQAKGLVKTALLNGVKGFFAEGSEEWATKWAQSAVDYMFGLQDEWNWAAQWRQANVAFTIGGLTGLGMGGAGAVAQKLAPNTETEVEVEPEETLDQLVEPLEAEETEAEVEIEAEVKEALRLYRGNVVDTSTDTQTKTNLPTQQDLVKDVLGRDPLTEAEAEVEAIEEALDDLEFEFEETQDPEVEADLLKKKEILEERLGFAVDAVNKYKDQASKSQQKQETIENSNFIYLTSQKETAESYASNADTMNENQALYGEGNYNSEIKAYDAVLDNTLDLTQFGEEGILKDWGQVEQVQEALGLSEEAREAVDKAIVETYGDIGASANEVIPVYAFFRAGIVEHIQDTLDNSDFDSVHYTEGSQDNYILFDESKLTEVQEELDSLDDKRTSRARELKQKIKDVEFIEEFEKTDESKEEAYKRIEQEYIEIEDKRTKRARELKQQLHALKEYAIKDIKTEIEKVKEKQGEPTEEIKVRMEINEELKKKAQKYIQLKAEEGIEVSEEEAVRLMTFNKPSNGSAINTTIVDTENPEVLKLLEEVSQILKDDPESTYAKIEDDANSSFSKEGKELSKEMGLLVKDGKRLAKVMKKAPSVVFRLQHLITKSAEQVTETAQTLNKTLSTLTELELANFAKQVQAHFSLTNDLLDIKSAWGRTGVAMKHRVNGEMVNVEAIDPALYEQDLEAQAKAKAVIDTLGGAKKLKQLIQDIANGNMDLEGLNKKVRNSTNKKITRAILENMSISVLGQAKTHNANILSQASNMLFEHLVHYSQATVNLVGRNQDAMTFAKANGMLLASLEGVLDSFVNPMVSMRDAAKAMFGEDLSRMEIAVLAMKNPIKFEQLREASGLTSRTQVEFARSHNLDMDTLFGDRGKNIPLISFVRNFLDYTNSFRRNTTFGVLQAGDNPFATEAYYSQLSYEIMELSRKLEDTVEGKPKEEFLIGLAKKARAVRKIKKLENVIEYRILKEAGTESEDVQDTLRNQIYNEITDGLISEISDTEMELIEGIDRKAIQYSDKMTWKDPFEDGTVLRGMEKFLNAHPSGKILGFLFFHTPMKILEKTTKVTVGRELRRSLMGKNGQKAQIEAIGTAAVSYGILIASSLLYLTNNMTGNPRDRKERELMRQAGVPENSIKINGKFYSFDRLEPMGYLMSLGANGARALHEALEDPDVESRLELAKNVLAETLGSMAQTMLNKSSLTGVLRTVNMLVNGGATGYFTGLLQTNDPLYSYRRNFTDISYGGFNPFFDENYSRNTGVVARDMFGKPIPKYDSLTQLNPTEPTSSPIRQELYDLQLGLSGFGSVFNGVKLTPEQRNEVLRYFDEEIEAEKRMSDFVESRAYQNLDSIPQKVTAIEQMWLSLKTEAQRQLVSDKQFREDYENMMLEKQEAWLNETEYPETMFKGDKTKNKLTEIIENFKSGE